ncbi:MAG: sugar phosphate nucleotidyltransferase [Chitinophagia bacterium]|jgi:glucose-1-phosphate thymidylyltransferase
MKAIIPVAGAGTKLRPHTYTQPKALIPLAGKTILGIIIDQLSQAGVKEFLLVVGYLGDKIADYAVANYPDLAITIIQQQERRGLGHAVFLCKEHVGNDEVVIVLGDTICEYNVSELMGQNGSVLCVKKVDDPRDFGVAETDENGHVSRLIEKPQIPRTNNALVGIYKIKETSLLFQCLETGITDAVFSGDELGLTSALDCMVSQGATFTTQKVSNWFDCGKKETLLESNATLLKKWGGTIADQDSFENTIIIPPVSIAMGCEIKNSIIGPNVSIGERTIIEYSIVRDSIIGAFSKLYDVVLNDSLIGSDTEIKGETRTLNIGDNTEIDLG